MILLKTCQPCWLILERPTYLLCSLSLSRWLAMLTEHVAGEDESSLAESGSHMGSETGDRSPGKAKLQGLPYVVASIKLRKFTCAGDQLLVVALGLLACSAQLVKGTEHVG